MKKNALPDVAHVVCALREKLVAQRCEALRMQVSRFLPGKGCALALRDRRVSDLEKVRIVEQLHVRGENGGLCRISFCMKRCAQCLDLTRVRGQSHQPSGPVRMRRRGLLFDHDCRPPQLISLTNREPGRSSYT
jgi:hypothetical protein